MKRLFLPHFPLARRAVVCFFVVVITAVLPAAEPEAIDDAAATEQAVYAPGTSGICFDAAFDGGRLCGCVALSENEYEVIIRPEDAPINNSAWYAFRVTSPEPRRITVRICYEGGSHRYHPKISSDGKHWTPLGPQAYSRDKKGAALELDVGPESLWVSAQEMIGSSELEAWIGRMSRLEFAERSIVGRSVEGRPIWRLKLAAGRPRGAVVILGRQHPPEVTGSIGLMRFAEALAAESEPADSFRQEFEILVFPLINPDGVAAGHWRHNVNGIDLNRDWGPFTQPETQAVRDEILNYQDETGPKLCLLLDFHSTHGDVFYVQGKDQPTEPADFAARWLQALSARLPNYKVRSAAEATERPTSKKWGYETFGIPSITCEFGDNTDRRLIRRVARRAAEEMIRLLLTERDQAAPYSSFRSTYAYRIP